MNTLIQIPLKQYLKLSMLVVFLFSLSCWSLKAQESDQYLVSPSGDTISIQAIPLLEMNNRLEAVTTQLNQFPEIIKPRKDIAELDSLFQFAESLLDNEEARIKASDNQLTLRNVEDYKKQWESYEVVLNKWKSTLSDRILELEEIYFQTSKIKEVWQLTKKEVEPEEAMQESLTRINDVLSKTNETKSKIKDRRDTVLSYQNKITDFQIRVNEMLTVLSKKRGELQSEYFIQDSRPIWSAGDSTMQVKEVKNQLSQSVNENIRQINIFLQSNRNNTIWLVVLFIFFLVLFFMLKRIFKVPDGMENDPQIIHSQIVFTLYPASAFLLAIASSLIIYSKIPTSVRELMQILILLPAIFIIPRLIHKSLYTLFIALVILFIIDEIQFFFIGKTFFARVLLLAEELFFMWLIIKLLHKDSNIYKNITPSFLPLIKNFKIIFLVLLIFAFFANVFGYVNLATIINNSVISSIMMGITLVILVVIFDSLFYSLFNTRFFEYSNIIKFQKEKIRKSLHTIFKYVAFFLWVRSILISLGVAEQTGAWLNGIFIYTWEFGSVSISFGGIIAFFLTIIVTVIVTNLVKAILEDEVFPRVRLSRGVPGAISMVVRYTLVAFGIYVAISAAGIDLDKFGLIAGALGVGIGFGLQGVVYNFISGLILAFERPIQKGDTIQVGTLMGDVTGIGVRASTIRTYDGSEVMIPNGNLISNEVTNWTLTDRKRRSIIPISVAYGSKPRDVMEIIAKVAGDHPEVLDFPKPWPLFDGFGDSALKFRILFWVDFDRRLTVTSEIAVNIYDALEEANIHIPFPQQDLHIKSFDPTVQKIVFPGKGDPGKKTGKSDGEG